MKSYRRELWFQVPGRAAFINITPRGEPNAFGALYFIRLRPGAERQ